MSAVYDTGTIAVTNGSATVTGTGTSWVGVLRAGWLISLPNGELVAVAAVVSATELTLVSDYTGTTQTGQAYWAIPTGGIARDLAAAVEARNADVQTMLDGPGSGKFGDGLVATPGIAFEADQDTGFYRKGDNAIGIVTGGVERGEFDAAGLLKGSVVQQSATDTTAGRLMRADFGYGPGNLLGTVSQSGGVPTGAVFERGSNANGEYVRFADGTQICTHVMSASSGGAATWTFPATFAVSPAVTGSGVNASARIFTIDPATLSATAVGFSLWNDGAGTRTASATYLTATGRWF